jgi:hypothetical protein
MKKQNTMLPGTVPKSNRNIVETERKPISLDTHVRRRSLDTRTSPFTFMDYHRHISNKIIAVIIQTIKSSKPNEAMMICPSKSYMLVNKMRSRHLDVPDCLQQMKNMLLCSDYLKK